MSAKKFDFKYLGSLHRKVQKRPEDGDMPIGNIQVDWSEFNLMYFIRRPVVVECPHGNWGSGDNLMALYGAMKMAFDNRTLGVFASSSDAYNLLSDDLYNSLVPRSKWRPKKDRMVMMKQRESFNVSLAEDWVFYVNFSDTFNYPGIEGLPEATAAALAIMDESRGFVDWKGADAVKPRWYGESVFNTHKIVLLWDSRYPEHLGRIKERYGKQFVFIEYGKEKAFVDGWFKENQTMLDPMFDIRLMEPGMDMKKVLLYAATNYLYKFREWGRFNPELLEKCFKKDDIKDLMGR